MAPESFAGIEFNPRASNSDRNKRYPPCGASAVLMSRFAAQAALAKRDEPAAPFQRGLPPSIGK
jgi:hypothetical protein